MTFLLTGSEADDVFDITTPHRMIVTFAGDDTVTTVEGAPLTFLSLGAGDDVLSAGTVVGGVSAGGGDDSLSFAAHVEEVRAGRGADTLSVSGGARFAVTGSDDDSVTIEAAPVTFLSQGSGDDTLNATARVDGVVGGAGADTLALLGGATEVRAGRGDDRVEIDGGAALVRLGAGDDELRLGDLVDRASGGVGDDTLVLDINAGQVDIEILEDGFRFTGRFSGATMDIDGFETVVFADRSFTAAELAASFDPDDALPVIQVGGGTQTVTVNDPTPTASVVWDRVVQQAVIETDSPTGPTVASRAYAMVHTAMYDAWSAFDATAVPVSFDLEGDNVETSGSDADKAEAMSWAAYTVLMDLFPDVAPLYAEVMETRFGYDLGAPSEIAEIGIDAAEDLLALRADDGANQSGAYADTTGYVPANGGPNAIVDITLWTPENVPIDPEDDDVEQSFLSPHWREVEGFALAEDASGATDFSGTLPPPPEPFFAPAFAGSTLDLAARTITLSAPLSLDGDTFAAGDTIPVTEALVGPVINPGFVAQAEEVVAFSGGLTDTQKIIAEFWEDGGGTAFPPGTWMTFGEFVSARDGHTLDMDAQMFLALGNAVMDAGIATWHSKVEYDYTRPVRAIRELGELGLIGEPGTDALTGETGNVIEAFGGFDAEGYGIGTQTILAANFNTFQRPFDNTSPPFAEYTSGHSAFSAAGAEVLSRMTGSDDFGAHVLFGIDTIQFERGVPEEEVTLMWETFSDAADEAGRSRLYGGIHFDDGDMNGRALGRIVGADAYEVAQRFIDGTATDADRPFFGEDAMLA